MHCVLDAFNDHIRYLGVKHKQSGDAMYHMARGAFGVEGFTPVSLVPIIYKAMLMSSYPEVNMVVYVDPNFCSKEIHLSQAETSLEYILVSIADYDRMGRINGGLLTGLGLKVITIDPAGIVLPTDTMHAVFRPSPNLDSERISMFIQLY